MPRRAACLLGLLACACAVCVTAIPERGPFVVESAGPIDKAMSSEDCYRNTYFSLPTARMSGTNYLVSAKRSSISIYCHEKGFAGAGWYVWVATNYTTFDGAFPRLGPVLNLEKNTRNSENGICWAGTCRFAVAIECLKKGAKICQPDEFGNIGSYNIGYFNFGVGNIGISNFGDYNTGLIGVGNQNTGDRVWGCKNSGKDLAGSKLAGKLLQSSDVLAAWGKCTGNEVQV